MSEFHESIRKIFEDIEVFLILHVKPFSEDLSYEGKLARQSLLASVRNVKSKYPTLANLNACSEFNTQQTDLNSTPNKDRNNLSPLNTDTGFSSQSNRSEYSVTSNKLDKKQKRFFRKKKQLLNEGNNAKGCNKNPASKNTENSNQSLENCAKKSKKRDEQKNMSTCNPDSEFITNNGQVKKTVKKSFIASIFSASSSQLTVTPANHKINAPIPEALHPTSSKRSCGRKAFGTSGFFSINKKSFQPALETSGQELTNRKSTFFNNTNKTTLGKGIRATKKDLKSGKMFELGHSAYSVPDISLSEDLIAENQELEEEEEEEGADEVVDIEFDFEEDEQGEDVATGKANQSEDESSLYNSRTHLIQNSFGQRVGDTTDPNPENIESDQRTVECQDQPTTTYSNLTMPYQYNKPKDNNKFKIYSSDLLERPNKFIDSSAEVSASSNCSSNKVGAVSNEQSLVNTDIGGGGLLRSSQSKVSQLLDKYFSSIINVTGDEENDSDDFTLNNLDSNHNNADRTIKENDENPSMITDSMSPSQSESECLDRNDPHKVVRNSDNGISFTRPNQISHQRRPFLHREEEEQEEVHIDNGTKPRPSNQLTPLDKNNYQNTEPELDGASRHGSLRCRKLKSIQNAAALSTSMTHLHFQDLDTGAGSINQFEDHIYVNSSFILALTGSLEESEDSVLQGEEMMEIKPPLPPRLKRIQTPTEDSIDTTAPTMTPMKTKSIIARQQCKKQMFASASNLHHAISSGRSEILENPEYYDIKASNTATAESVQPSRAFKINDNEVRARHEFGAFATALRHRNRIHNFSGQDSFRGSLLDIPARQRKISCLYRTNPDSPYGIINANGNNVGSETAINKLKYQKNNNYYHGSSMLRHNNKKNLSYVLERQNHFDGGRAFPVRRGLDELIEPYNNHPSHRLVPRMNHHDSLNYIDEPAMPRRTFSNFPPKDNILQSSVPPIHPRGMSQEGRSLPRRQDSKYIGSTAAFNYERSPRSSNVAAFTVEMNRSNQMGSVTNSGRHLKGGGEQSSPNWGLHYEDELVLRRGEPVYVTEKKYDSLGWWMGVSLKTGERGLIPKARLLPTQGTNSSGHEGSELAGTYVTADKRSNTHYYIYCP